MKRYERQMKLPEIGSFGQQKLAESKVLIVGMGGLGCPVLQSLVGAGVGSIGIVDGDIVEENNLHRQFLYSPQDCGRNKAEVAAKIMSTQNPGIKVSQYPVYFNNQNCLEITADYQIIVDCTDNIAARYLINDVAVEKGIPMVYASVHKFEGQLSVFNYNDGPTYRCLFPENERLDAIPDCNDSGVLGVLPNVMGVLQANEVLKIILGIGEVLSGILLLYNSLDNTTQNIEIKKNNFIKTNFNVAILGVTRAQFLEEQNAVFIDIREDYEEPKLELYNVKNVPLSRLDVFLRGIDADQKIILCCQNGSRSALAVEYLVKKGFDNVFHLQNGIECLEKMDYDNR